MKILAFAGCKNTTMECMQTLMEDGYKIDYLITLTPEQGRKYVVSGYADMTEFAERHGISVYHPISYGLKDKRDEKALSKLGIDILMVIGWQRLIPKWFLDRLPIGAFGMHGSAELLPKGRGRSPINWSLIEGKKSFFAHLFKYDEGVDSGAIVDIQEFDINPFDTCETLHFKNRVIMNRLLKKNLSALLNETVQLQAQPVDVEPTYYPKRTSEDGIIDWNKSTEDIYNLIRAVTHPFPGAFTFLGKSRVYIWRAQPFDTKILYSEKVNGEIVEAFYNNSFLVKTSDGSLLVTEFDGVPTESIRKGAVFHSYF
ncbi:methionyl-tRNA formyltransferase [Chloroflexota bacterium]